MTSKQISRFYSRIMLIPDTNGCQVWTDRVTIDGYGRISLGHKEILAHRIAYQLHYKVDPGKQLVRHTCDNPPCCNPKHLVLGSSRDNVRDSVERGRHSSVLLRGERRPNSVLKPEQIIQIRYKRALGYTLMSLGKEYGVDYTTIAQIVDRRTWTHI